MALRPEAVLARGFALVSQGGQVVTDAAQVDPAESLHIQFKDGEITVRKSEEEE